MVTIDDAMKLLKEKGYEPYDDNGCIMICTPLAEDSDIMTKILSKAGYKYSYGWKMKHETSV